MIGIKGLVGVGVYQLSQMLFSRFKPPALEIDDEQLFQGLAVALVQRQDLVKQGFRA